jgi:hypothetical protein
MFEELSAGLETSPAARKCFNCNFFSSHKKYLFGSGFSNSLDPDPEHRLGR